MSEQTIQDIKQLHDDIWPALMNATSNESKKEDWRLAMALTEIEQKKLIRLLNRIDDFCCSYLCMDSENLPVMNVPTDERVWFESKCAPGAVVTVDADTVTTLMSVAIGYKREADQLTKLCELAREAEPMIVAKAEAQGRESGLKEAAQIVERYSHGSTR